MEAINYLKLKRQNLIDCNDADYEKMFRLMSPVPTLFWTSPGEPPVIQYRSKMDDRAANNFSRANRIIIKGRFRGGNVGYIYADELPLFMAAYKKEINRFTENDELILETLRCEGAMNIEIIKEITGLLSKHISASLQKLQKAFIVYEDQVDNEWDRSWYILEDEFSDVDLNAFTKEEAVQEVIKRFTYLNVFVDESMIKSFTRIAARDIRNALLFLLEKQILTKTEISGKNGYILAFDQSEITACSGDIPDKTYIMDLNDYLVRSHEEELKRRFDPSPYKTLHYIMKKGKFIGILAGRFSFGPNELEDVRLDLCEQDKEIFRKDIEKAVERIYNPEETRLLRYCGKPIEHQNTTKSC